MKPKRLTEQEIEAIARAILQKDDSHMISERPGYSCIRPKMIVGNWKMNLGLKQADALLKDLARLLPANEKTIVVAPPALYLDRASQILPGHVKLAAQNVSDATEGALTGEIACSMLKEMNVLFTIIGHSERRSLLGETSQHVYKKSARAVQDGLTPIVCFGETLDQRQGDYLNLIRKQVLDSILPLSEDVVRRCVLAYEPVWAIGTGKTASPCQAQEVHFMVRSTLAQTYSNQLADGMIILYGGSVNASNINELIKMEDIDGALVGGASLSADQFAKICA